MARERRRIRRSLVFSFLFPILFGSMLVWGLAGDSVWGGEAEESGGGVSAASASKGGLPKTQGWRTDGTGRYPDADPPVSWDAGTHVVWRSDLGGWSNATPVLSGDRVFCNVEPFKLVCLERESGKLLWEQDHDYSKVKHSGDVPRCHDVTGFSSPTPTTDGARVFGLYGNGVACAYSVEGKRLWIRLVDKPRRGWGQSSSPLLVGDRLIVAVNDLFALDAGTGKEVWRVSSKPSWGSPVQTMLGEVPVVISCAGQIIRAVDGKVLCEGLGELEFNAPIIEDRIVYFMSQDARAYRLPRQFTSDQGSVKPEKLWEARLKRDRYYASPVLHQGRIYSITRARILTVVDAGSGEEVEEIRMGRRGGEMYSSITSAGDYLFVTGEDGRTSVLTSGEEGLETVEQNKMKGVRSCPVFDGDRMYLRAGSSLFCIAD